MGRFQREIMRNHWILDVLPWRHAHINILNVSTVGGDHPKTSPGVEYWCNIMLPESWQHFCWIFVFQLGGVFGVSYDSYDGEPETHINPEECCDCTCQKLRSHDLKNQVLDVDFSLQNFSGSIQGPRNSSGLLVKMLKFAGPLGFHGISSCVI